MSIQSEFRLGIAQRIRSTIGLGARLRDDRIPTVGFGRGLFVVGMHRSGTSAAARAVNLMGVPFGNPTDLIQAHPESKRQGYWESRSLAGFNDRLLGHFGGNWSAPPYLSNGWERDERVKVLANEARRTFASVYSEPDWAWKDPRLCLTLPFWRSVLPAQTAGILIFRHPIEVARSLETRNRLPLVYGMALWELYNRQALRGLVGLPVFVTTYDTLLHDPFAWCDSIARFIGSLGNSSRPAGL